MAGKDKHPPMDWSTNKRIPAKTTTTFGTPVKTAIGPKKIRPSEPNRTSAKTVPAYETKAMAMERDRKLGIVDPVKLNDMKRFFKQRNT